MRILIIDDRRVLSVPGDADVVYARTLEQAWSALRDGRWDQVWFDHDLGEVDGVAQEAYPVAVELEAAARGHAAPVDVGRVFVISDNGVGADRIVAALRDYDVVRVPSNDVTVAVL